MREPVAWSAATPRPLRVVALSAATPEDLRAKARRSAQALAVTSPDADALRRRAHSVSNGDAHRLAAVADSNAALAWQLGAFARGEQVAGVEVGSQNRETASRVAFLFTGLGAEFAGMGRQLFATQPVFRRELERCDRLFRRATGRALLTEGNPPFGDPAAIEATEIVQPALFAFEYALAQLWREWGVVPSAVLGHSLGEDVAACIAGVLALPDALELVAARARLMEQLPAGGAMAAIFADEGYVRHAIGGYEGRIEIAAINGPTNVVVAGAANVIDDLLDRLEPAGIRTRRVKASRAFHSALMDPMLAELERVAARVAFGAPRVPIVSGVTGSWASADEMVTPAYWRRHLRDPVRFFDGIRRLYADGYRIFVEIGPHPTLLGMARRCIPETDATCAPTLRRHDDDLGVAARSLAHVFVRGVDVRWSALEPRPAALKVTRSLFETGS